MIAFIIWLVGVVLGIKAAIQILDLQGDTVKKLLFVILLVMTSWFGIFVYYFYAKDKIADWVK